MVAVHAEFEEEVDPREAVRILENFSSEPQHLKLPTAPEKPIHVRREKDRPQPRYDRDAEGGMSVVVGRIRKGANKHSLLFIVVGHNTVRGAAGQAILLAELLRAKTMI
ncbi:MAG: Asd/ArgC dimerization domain-containing protein, partial [Candidatus Korarchaeota archaeon]|nr:Asd/ArgC dimerization domain-containing protein [Candidatus Korarchaeota archaeon]